VVFLATLIAAGLALYFAVAVGGAPNRWQAIADGEFNDVWPPPDAKIATVAGIKAARWAENPATEDEHAAPYLLVTEARVPGLRAAPDPRLRELVSAAALGAMTYGETVRLERTGNDSYSEWPGDAARVAIVGLCGSRDYDDVLAALLELASQPEHLERVGALLLDLERGRRIDTFARAVLEGRHPPVQSLGNAARSELRARAACYLKNVQGLSLSFASKPKLSEAVDRRVGRALLAAAPDRARAIARARLRDAPFRNTRLLLELIAPPHFEPGDTALFAQIADANLHREALTLAVDRLGQIDDAPARAALASLLLPHKGELVERAASYLSPGRTGRLSHLHALLKDGSNDEQRFAAQWLGWLGTLKDVAPLAQVRDNRLESSAVRDAAKLAALDIQGRGSGEAGAFSLADSGDEGALSLSTDAGEGALSVTDTESDILQTPDSRLRTEK